MKPMLRPMLRRPKLGSAVYVLPNLITTGNLFCGFFAIIRTLQGDFGGAALAIMLAGIFDILDGRIARLTKGTSEFGVQFDSLCDLVSFGVAPAFLAYQYGLFTFQRPGWIACFLFLACGALRLARFNVQSAVGKASGDFTGLPIPMAAYVIACFVAFATDVTGDRVSDIPWLQDTWMMVSEEAVRRWVLMAITPTLGLLMVSNFAYRSHKSIKIRAVRPFKLLVLIISSSALVAFLPSIAGMLITFGYAVSGPIEWLVGWKKAHDDDDFFEPLPEGDLIEPDMTDEVGETMDVTNIKGRSE
jgi:CDP-diacylglycerol--serine O-phosphatidyltransferase